MAATSAAIGTNWRLRGQVVSIQEFIEYLWAESDLQVLIERRDNRQVVGLVQLYALDIQSGHAKLSAFILEEYMHAGWPFEGLGLFLHYAFTIWPLRKVYVEAPDFALEHYESAFRSMLIEEGRLRNHVWQDGRTHDLVIGALYRDRWLEAAAKLGYESEPSTADDPPSGSD